MISALKWIWTDCTDPYRNLAAEKLLTLGVREGECILFLWQNRRTVVIGRNQNAWAECRVRQLTEDGGHLARRLSGGGAVYHDLGNLNFSFAVRKAEDDPEGQAEVIRRAAEKLGIAAQETGRNDFEAGGRKFSGSAYFETHGCRCHHGTLMMDVDTEALSRYLTVNGAKLRSKGVASVRSRVINLKELCPDVTAERLKGALLEAFAEIYGLPVESLELDRLREEEILREAEVLSSNSWLFPPRLSFAAALENRYPWGGIRIGLSVRGDLVDGALCESDAMDESMIRRIQSCLPGCLYNGKELAARVTGIAPEAGEAAFERELRQRMQQDIAEMILEQIP